MSNDDDIQYPSGFGAKDIVGWGTTGLVVLDAPSKTVIKTPFDPSNEEFVKPIAKEREIYERLAERGGHKGILSYHGTFESGIRLELASNYHLKSFYKKKPEVTIRQRLRWVTQIAEALGFIHNAGVIHGDLTCANILLDENLHAKLADFAGSSLDGSPLLIAVTASHEYPGTLLSIQADIFAFGSVVYEIMTGHAPYEGLSDREIATRYSQYEFPDTTSLGATGDIIRNCWKGKYRACRAIVNDLRAQQAKPIMDQYTVLVTIAVITMAFVLYPGLLAQPCWLLRR